MAPERTNGFIALGIDDVLLRAILLEWLSRQAASSEASAAATGFANAGFRELRKMTLADMRRVAESASDCVQIVIDPAALAKAIDAAAADREAADSLDFLIRNDATRGMIADVLGIRNERLSDARRRIGMPAGSRGRPKLPPPDVRDAIGRRWSELSGVRDIDRFKALLEEFPQWNLASLAGAVSDFVSIAAKETA